MRPQSRRCVKRWTTEEEKSVYIKYVDEWLHPCVREVEAISIRRSDVDEDDGTIAEGAELYDPGRGSGFGAEDDRAALRWFSSWAVACRMLDKLCAALDAGKQFFNLTAYGEDGEVLYGKE